MEDRIKETGRKAHIRLEEEKSKRKEIVRLNVEELKKRTAPELSKKRARSTFSESVKRSSRNPRKSVNAKLSRRKILRLSKEENTNNADLWTPTTERLSCHSLSTDESSNVIRLHGLPIGVKFDHIRKFFSGLSPERIFTLPSLNTSIHDFDLEENCREEVLGADPFVKRYPNYFRVYVKFTSYPIANAAISRAGETILVEDEANGPISVGAAISITPVPKSIASHLLKYMAIDGMRGRTLEETTSEVQDNCPQLINQILWVMAGRKVGLNVKISKIGGGPYTTIFVSNLDVTLVPSNTADYRKIVVTYNHLWDMHGKLLSECMPTQLHKFDLSTGDLEPGEHLISVAGNWLLDEMILMNQSLVQYRHYIRRK